jgi:hypothetical protein
LQGFLFQVEVSEIIVHEACEPNAVVDFLDAEFLTGQHGGDVDPLAMQAATLVEQANYITKLPKAENTAPEWRDAMPDGRD